MKIMPNKLGGLLKTKKLNFLKKNLKEKKMEPYPSSNT